MKSGAKKGKAAKAAKEKEAKEKKGAPKGPKPKQFRVQAHIIEAKGAKARAGVLPDLVVMAQVTGQSCKFTQVVRSCSECHFDTHLSWSFQMTFEEFHNAELTFHLLNAGTDARADPLGVYEVKLAQIRKQPMSEYFCVWLALYPSSQLYVSELGPALRISCACLGGMQRLSQHTQDETDEALTDDNPVVLMPPLVRWTFYSLFVAVYRIEGLPSMNAYGDATDAFVAAKVHGQAAIKTKARQAITTTTAATAGHVPDVTTGDPQRARARVQRAAPPADRAPEDERYADDHRRRLRSVGVRRDDR